MIRGVHLRSMTDEGPDQRYIVSGRVKWATGEMPTQDFISVPEPANGIWFCPSFQKHLSNSWTTHSM
jgi:hypothetical protein